jgi:hypothetical protein
MNNTIQIAVSGHRYLTKTWVIKRSLQQVMQTIISRHSGSDFVFQSPLAPGADQIAARVALGVNRVSLKVVLPMPIAKYLTDFSMLQKIDFWRLYKKRDHQVLLPLQSTRNKSFLELGKFLVGNSDYLIAVWDGKKELGTGGTAQVFDMARESGTKIAWIRAANMVPENHVMPSDIHHQGRVEHINWD